MRNGMKSFLNKHLYFFALALSWEIFEKFLVKSRLFDFLAAINHVIFWKGFKRIYKLVYLSCASSIQSIKQEIITPIYTKSLVNATFGSGKNSHWSKTILIALTSVTNDHSFCKFWEILSKIESTYLIS